MNIPFVERLVLWLMLFSPSSHSFLPFKAYIIARRLLDPRVHSTSNVPIIHVSKETHLFDPNYSDRASVPCFLDTDNHLFVSPHANLLPSGTISTSRNLIFPSFNTTNACSIPSRSIGKGCTCGLTSCLAAKASMRSITVLDATTVSWIVIPFNKNGIAGKLMFLGPIVSEKILALGASSDI